MPPSRSEPVTRGRNSAPCPECGTVLGRAYDLRRHMKTHNREVEAIKCPLPDCNFSAIQKSNLKTHLKTHIRLKDLACTDDPDNCTFCTTDPSALLRHRTRLHGYVPKRYTKRTARATDPKTTKAESDIPCKASPSATPELSWPSAECTLSSMSTTPELVASPSSSATTECDEQMMLQYTGDLSFDLLDQHILSLQQLAPQQQYETASPLSSTLLLPAASTSQYGLEFKASDGFYQFLPTPDNLNWDSIHFPTQTEVDLLSTLTPEELKELDALVNYPGVPGSRTQSPSLYAQYQSPSNYSNQIYQL